ncbi:MAG: IMP cyclohydrolase [Deltaproteobacteria bacterium]|jgi:phosphoribosylaminoimidazolecarboxamide formyltransferase/IMP cyclohydrolase|nr:IMP cyclohydrolase [Deltaproteobacteria bacterium]
MDLLPVKRALLSVTDKTGLLEFASFLADRGVELVSTGGTHTVLREAGLPAATVSEVTGFPEILGGRVKTLHPHIHGGILADKNDAGHMRALQECKIRPYDLVCVNLYDFSGAVAKNLDEAGTIEEIDIGGPCLLRAAAKNFHSVLALPDIKFYEPAKEELVRNDMRVSLAFRRITAEASFAATSAYDALIAGWLRNNSI